MKRSRMVLYVFVGVGLLSIVPIVGTYVYVASGAADGRIAAQLRAAIGMPVVVGGAHLGISGLTLRQVKVFGRSGEQGTAPWLSIGSLATDLGTWDLLRGTASTRRITVSDAALTLDFDTKGRLTTSLAAEQSANQPLPEVTIENSQVTIHQEGHPPLVVTGARGTVVSHDGRLELTGSVADPQWGDWTVGLSLDRLSNRAELHLQTPKAHVTRAMLESLPFVPAEVWTQVHAEGDSAAELTLRLGPDVSYRIVLDAQSVRIGVTALDLEATDVTGQAVIEDQQVHIHKGQGQTADGTMRIDGDMDFRGKTTELHFNVVSEGVEVRKLPARWKVPELIEGKLNGQANLQVSIVDGKLQTTGTGEGLIPDGRIRVGTQLLSSAIRLALSSSDQGFRFDTPAQR